MKEKKNTKKKTTNKKKVENVKKVIHKKAETKKVETKKVDNIKVEKEIVEKRLEVKSVEKPKNNKKEISIIDLLSLRINETLKSERKNTTADNNPYFWIVKFFILVFSIIGISILFDVIREVGTEAIYEINRSLRSILAGIWGFTVSFMKYILILHTVYINVKSFVKSPYYERLYAKDKEMRIKKELLFEKILRILKTLSIPFLVVLLLTGAFALFIFFYFIFIWINGTFIISPFLISISIILISYLAYKHILVGFYDAKYKINRKAYVLILLALLFSSALIFCELKDFKYDHSLPVAFETKKKVTTFDISARDKVIIKSNSKLNNVKVYKNDSLKDEIKIYIEYYDTAKVEYIYEYNDDNSLILTFNSKQNVKITDIPAILGIIEKGLIDKTIYNFNLFKYPNIKIYVNMNNADRIFIK